MLAKKVLRFSQLGRAACILETQMATFGDLRKKDPFKSKIYIFEIFHFPVLAAIFSQFVRSNSVKSLPAFPGPSVQPCQK